jgi:hypothetical protein
LVHAWRYSISQQVEQSLSLTYRWILQKRHQLGGLLGVQRQRWYFLDGALCNVLAIGS